MTRGLVHEIPDFFDCADAKPSPDTCHEPALHLDPAAAAVHDGEDAADSKSGVHRTIDDDRCERLVGLAQHYAYQFASVSMLLLLEEVSNKSRTKGKDEMQRAINKGIAIIGLGTTKAQKHGGQCYGVLDDRG